MTLQAKYDIMNPTSLCSADAPTEKEAKDMSGAKITALYCRLSQEDERLGESLSIEHQKEILLQYAKEHRFPNPVFFVDDGYSGTDFERPGFKKMLSEIEGGNVGILLTKDLSVRTLGYAAELMRQEAAILGSDVVVLDTYCIPASMLIMMIHALLMGVNEALTEVKG